MRSCSSGRTQRLQQQAERLFISSLVSTKLKPVWHICAVTARATAS